MHIFTKITLSMICVFCLGACVFFYATFDRDTNVDYSTVGATQNTRDVQCIIDDFHLDTFSIVMPAFERSADMSVDDKERAYAMEFCKLMAK